MVVDELLTDILPHVRYLWNCSAPILKLPDEILTLIFKLVQEEGVNRLPWSTAFDLRTIAPLRWMRVMRVCSRWRVVALSSSLLWRHIALSAPHNRWSRSRGPYPALFLSLSAAVPLRVAISTIAGILPEATEVVAQLPRIRHLYLVGDGFSDDQLGILKQPAPQLETLACTSSVGPASALLAGGQHPSLRSLFLQQGSLQLKIDSKTLRQLHLAFPWYRTTEEYQNLLVILRQAHCLEDLKFSDTNFHISDEPRHTARTLVHLPMLKRLSFTLATRLDMLLNWLRLPDGVCLSHLSPRGPGVHIFPAVCSQLGDLQRLKRLSLVYYQAEGGYFNMCAVGESSSL